MWRAFSRSSPYLGRVLGTLAGLLSYAIGILFTYGVFVALLTPIAVIASYALMRDASEQVLGALEAAAGGPFLYVGAADLLPEGQATGLRRNTVIFLLGVAVIVLMLTLGVEPG